MTGRTPLACLVTITALASVLIFGTAGASASPPCAECVPHVFTISKSGPAYVNQGDPATYTITLHNFTRIDDVSNVVVTDTKCSPVSGPTGDTGNDGILGPDEYWNYTCTYSPQDAPGTTVTNTATASGDASNEIGFVQESASHDTFITALHVVKDVDLSTADPYDQLNYTITVSNDGPADYAYSFSMVDDGCEKMTSDDRQTDVTDSGHYVMPGQKVVFHCSHTFDPSPDHDGSTYTNTACAYAYPDWLDTQTANSVGADEAPQLQVCDDAVTTLATHTVTGTVFEDMNADGVKQSNEPAYSGVVIYGDVNGNGKRDEGEPSTTSDGQGNYSLTIALGTTTIREETPSGGTCSFPTGCAYTVDLAKNSPPPPPDVNTRAVDPTGKDFGNWRPASVSGTVVNDANGNGVRDLGEAGVGGIQVYADLNGNGALDAGEPSTTSAADGSYTVAGLKPGGYVIRHVLPQGPTCTGPANCNYNLVLQSHSAEVSRNFFEMTPVITPAPEQLVLPERIIPGIARLVGKTGCISGTGFTARIRGVKMIRLIFFIDGTAAKAVTLPQDNQTYRYRVDIRKMRIGRHTLAVKVVYRTKTRTNSKTLRLTFQRCAAQLRAPAFTG